MGGCSTSVANFENKNYNNDKYSIIASSSTSQEMMINNSMSPDQCSIACFNMIENELWSDADNMIENYIINTNLHIHHKQSDLPTLACRMTRPFAKDSIQKKLCLKIIKLSDQKEVLNALFRDEDGDNLIMHEIKWSGKLKIPVDLELIHYLIVCGTNLHYTNKLNLDVLTLAIRTKNTKLIQLIIYHLNFKGSKQEQFMLPHFIK